MASRLILFIGAAAGRDCATWYEGAAHGTAFRSVADFGAVGNLISGWAQGEGPHSLV